VGTLAAKTPDADADSQRSAGDECRELPFADETTFRATF
jgi:hypothetical protein